jgi:hypothetical protein
MVEILQTTELPFKGRLNSRHKTGTLSTVEILQTTELPFKGRLPILRMVYPQRRSRHCLQAAHGDAL